MPKSNPRTRKLSLLTLLFVAPLFLSLTQCHAAAPPIVGAEHCGGVACSSNLNCTANVPVCAISSSGTCLTTTPRECAWKLNISSACPCMEHDVRLCDFSGSPGVQICTKNSSTSTYWAACIACPSCTI
jgi:hypothetical protein